MRLLRLARIAMEAEGLRLRHQARRAAARAIVAYFAVILLFGAFCFAHLAGWFWLRESLSLVQVSLVLTGADLVLAILLALFAIRSTPGPVEREALAVRRRAMEDAADSVTVSALMIRAFEAIISSRRKS